MIKNKLSLLPEAVLQRVGGAGSEAAEGSAVPRIYGDRTSVRQTCDGQGDVLAGAKSDQKM